MLVDRKEPSVGVVLLSREKTGCAIGHPRAKGVKHDANLHWTACGGGVTKNAKGDGGKNSKNGLKIKKKPKAEPAFSQKWGEKKKQKMGALAWGRGSQGRG